MASPSLTPWAPFVILLASLPSGSPLSVLSPSQSRSFSKSSPKFLVGLSKTSGTLFLSY
uniref:Uncharacterized protein n=1 Tax=Oryza brachyantha TaxID=4533 RepID=J3LAR9_ORYBR